MSTAQALTDAEMRQKLVNVLPDNVLPYLSDAEVRAYYLYRKPWVKTARGHFLNDPRRMKRSARDWTDAELADWLEDALKPSQEAPPEALMDELYRRRKLSPCIYNRDAKAFLLHGTPIPKTSDGLWVRDRLRDAKLAQHWHLRELKAWCIGEISATHLAPDKALIATLRARFGVNQNYSEERLKHSMKDYLVESTMTALAITQTLESYADTMKVGKVLPDSKAAPAQLMLYRAIRRIMTLEGRDFTDNWTALLDFFYEHRQDLFTDTNALRGVHAMTLSANDYRSFEALINLLLKTADPSTRGVELKKIDLIRTLAYVTDEGQRNNVIGYYEPYRA